MRATITWLAVVAPMVASSPALADEVGETNDAPVTPTPPPLPPANDAPVAPTDAAPVDPANPAPAPAPTSAAPVVAAPPAAPPAAAPSAIVIPPTNSPTGGARSAKRPGSAAEPALGVGPSMGGFFGLTYLAAALKFDVVLPGEEWIRPAILTELDIGSTEHGLRIYRTYFGGGGVFVIDSVRIGIGARIAYTMVERITKGSAFGNALFGDIGGFGIGPVAWLSLDVVRTEDFSIGPAVKVSGDIYKNAGTGYSGTALLEARF